MTMMFKKAHQKFFQYREYQTDPDGLSISYPTETAPLFISHMINIWFSDGISKKEGKMWKYWAVALHVDSRDRITTEWEGTTQVGKSIAVCSSIKNEAENTDPHYILIDLYAVPKECTEWLTFWEQNEWEVNWLLT